MDVRRFGVGHRRTEGPAGSHGVEGLALHADPNGALAEMAFRPHAALAPHSSLSVTYFVVIEGGGFVQVGEERSRVAAGEAVVWPPGVVHAAWTEETPMRALVVEFPAPDAPRLIEAGPAAAGPIAGSDAAAEGRVVRLSAPPNDPPPDRTTPEQEPW